MSAGLKDLGKHEKGIYLLIMKNHGVDRSIVVGGIGTFMIPSQRRYVYIGSAMGGLYHRLKRHLSDTKKVHWHVDYLLEHLSIIAFCYAITTRRLECDLSGEFHAHPGEKFDPLHGVGNSDCKRCPAHAYAVPSRLSMERLQAIVSSSFRTLELKPRFLHIRR